ncbi:FHIPEP family type III secretion protein [Marininema halotolerans]|uniref:FHIPEP family protein n=1 Tax=Marininema halotolerans TaxID=1155944 RepID=A0A1I6NTK9_9BACL|nr:FHIPEP family type III secretion protein [Marininema halotolerans]SFS31214.1 FHIPEP family protein [Marininema halotolerans]
MTDWTLTDAYGEQQGDLFSIILGPDLYEFLLNDSHFTAEIRRLRKQLFRQFGFYLPSIRIRIGNMSEPQHYTLSIRGNQVAVGQLRPPLRFSKAEEGKATPTDIHPILHIPGNWSDQPGEESRDILLSHVEQVLQRRLPELLTYEGVGLWLKQAESHAPSLIKELTNQGVTTGLLWSVMKRLIQDGISIAPFEELLETMLEFYLENPHDGYTPPEWTRPHPTEITKYITEKKKNRKSAIHFRTGKIIGFSR